MKQFIYFPILLVFLFFMGASISAAIAQEADDNGVVEDTLINADDGIDWLRDEQKYIARGNAVIERGDMRINAAQITAHYDLIKNKDGSESEQITRIDALGNVIMQNGDTLAYGEKAVYYYDRQVMVMIGRNLRIINQQGIMTANDSLEYWDRQDIAVARGEATIHDGETIIKAGALSATIDQTSREGEPQMRRVDATGGVHISTPEEILTGDEGVYNVIEERFRLCGNVKITRGENQLNGACADLDMATGRSTLEGGGGQIRGLLKSPPD